MTRTTATTLPVRRGPASPWPRRLAAGAGLCAALGALGGCEFPRRAASSPAEYEAYRGVRAALTVEDRLAFAERYLAAYPKGRFSDEVRQHFAREEQAFYDRQQASAAGLTWYLERLPAGPHAPQASLRLADLEREASLARQDSLLAQGRVSERRLARAAASRKEIVEFVTTWVSTLAGSDAWGLATWRQPPEIIASFRRGVEPGACDDLGCHRAQVLPFQVPLDGGGLEERAFITELALDLRRGGVARASLRGPALFSRFHEAAVGRPAASEPIVARTEAITFVLELIMGAFEGVAPAARCERGITPPVVLRRQCSGWVIEVVSGDKPEDDDVISVEGPSR
jgi:hypothetical protein